VVAVVTRDEWGAAFAIPTDRHVPLSARRAFVVHWPGGNVGADEAAVVRSIERQHRQTQGWLSAPGYNFLVGQSGAIFEGCGRDVRGVHSPPRNVDGFGVCVLAPITTPASPAALASTRDLYDDLSRVCGRELVRTWHAADFATACPGPQLIEWVRGGMDAGAIAPARRKVGNMICQDPVSGGYWIAWPDGAVHTARGAPFLGGANNDKANPGRFPCIGIAPRPEADGGGYVLALDFTAAKEGDRARFYDYPRDGSHRG